MIYKAYKFRLYPTASQTILLTKTFGCVRFVWNKLTENFNNYGSDLFCVKINEKVLKDEEEFFWLKEVSAAALQQKRMDFEQTKKQFFDKKRKIKIGSPKFKKKGIKETYRLPNQKFSIDYENKAICLEKIGSIKMIIDRKIPEEALLKSVTLSKNSCEQYFASVLVEQEQILYPLSGRSVGVDVGIKSFVTTSTGIEIENPHWFIDSQNELKKAQQHLSKKIKDSKRYIKQKFKVSEIHLKIKNQRNWFLHNVSSWFVKNHDVIVIEDLNVAGMVKNHKLAKHIYDVSWCEFFRQLNYKCDWYGKTLLKVNRFYASSKTCSCCGHKLKRLGLGIRSWVCPECNTKHHRDLNASINILNKGLKDTFNLSSVETIEYKHIELHQNIVFRELMLSQ